MIPVSPGWVGRYARVATVYNQWTQFEDFPHFMEGVESVTQLDDKRLHWVAEIAGAREEWPSTAHPKKLEASWRFRRCPRKPRR